MKSGQLDVCTGPGGTRGALRLAAIAAFLLAAAGSGLAQDAPDPVAPAQDGPAIIFDEPAAPAPGPESPALAPAPEAPASPADEPAPATTEAAEDADPALDAPAETPDPALAPPASDQADMPMIEHGLQHDLSPWGMFMMADIVVKAVMIGLATAALVTWIIWLGKWLQLIGARGRARRTLRTVAQAESLDVAVANLEKRKGVGVLLAKAAHEEMAASSDLLGQVPASGIKERVSSRLSRIQAAAGRKMSQGTGILASIGSVAPFVGLFGTVWGIMNSFVSIAETQTTNLAVVAPGIAEALLATAIGLVAAIPAVIIYNAFARSITGYRQLLADVSAGIERLVSRDLDRHAVAIAQRHHTKAAE